MAKQIAPILGIDPTKLSKLKKKEMQSDELFKSCFESGKPAGRGTLLMAFNDRSN